MYELHRLKISVMATQEQALEVIKRAQMNMDKKGREDG